MQAAARFPSVPVSGNPNNNSAEAMDFSDCAIDIGAVFARLSAKEFCYICKLRKRDNALLMAVCLNSDRIIRDIRDSVLSIGNAEYKSEVYEVRSPEGNPMHRAILQFQATPALESDGKFVRFRYGPKTANSRLAIIGRYESNLQFPSPNNVYYSYSSSKSFCMVYNVRLGTPTLKMRELTFEFIAKDDPTSEETTNLRKSLLILRTSNLYGHHEEVRDARVQIEKDYANCIRKGRMAFKISVLAEQASHYMFFDIREKHYGPVVIAVRGDRDWRFPGRCPNIDNVIKMHLTAALDIATAELTIDHMCLVCRKRPKTMGFIHGGTCHTVVCEPCCQKIMRQRLPKCLYCNATVERVVQNCT